MNDDAERIRRQMQDVRQEMGAEVHDIVKGARELTDWRYYVRRHPWACVAGAFTLGFLASPARKKILAKGVDVDGILAELRKQGLASATGAAPLYPGGIAGKLLAVAGPILLKRAAEFISQKLAASAAPHPPPEQVTDPDPLDAP